MKTKKISTIKHIKGSYCAFVEVLWANREISDLMAAADLGLTGIGVKDVITLNYKPGVDVDEARVAKAMDDMIKESNIIKTPAYVLNYKIISLDFIPA